MAAPPIRIRVGAAMDNSVHDVFKSVIAAARLARKAVEAELGNIKIGASVAGGGGAKGVAREAKATQDAHAKAVEYVANLKQKQLAKQYREEDAAEKRAQRRKEAAERYVAGIKQRQQAKEHRAEEAEKKRLAKLKERGDLQAAKRAEQAARIAKREIAAQERERARASFKAVTQKLKQDRIAEAKSLDERKERGRAIAGGAVGNLGAIGKGALGVAGSVARGAGVQTDLAAFVGQAVELETRATELSAAAFSGTGARRAVRTTGSERGLVETARDIGKAAAFDPVKVIEGLQAFVGKTGDLKTGEAALFGLAKLSRATGTGLEDMVSAAGDVALALGDPGPGKAFQTLEEKGALVVQTMRMIAGQGKVGAVEIKDLATGMAKVSAASTAFGGSAQKNLEFMGALAQMARAGGGAASAPEAVTAVSGFVNTLRTPARVKEFMAHGMKKEDIFDEKGSLRDPQSIIFGALKASKGDPIEFKKMFANVQGARTVEPAAAAFREARGRALAGGASEEEAAKAGVEAAKTLFDKFTKAISAEEESESFKRSMDTGAAKVQLFNNRLSEIGAKIAEKVLPQLEKLAPSIIGLAEGLSTLTAFAIDNPIKAGVIALGASIGKAAVGNVITTGLQKMLESAAGKGGGLALGTAAITIAAATLIAKSIVDEREKGAAGAEEQRAFVAGDIAKIEAATKESGSVTPENLEALKSQRATIQAQIKEGQAFFEEGKEQRYTGLAGGARQIYDVMTTPTTFQDIGRGKSAMEAQPELLGLRDRIDRLIASVEGSAKKTQKVEVTNPSAFHPVGGFGPVADASNTTK